MSLPYPTARARRRVRRPLAAAAAGALLAPLLPLLAGTASAAYPAAPAADVPEVEAPAAVLRWEVSQQFDDHLSSHTLAGGATEDGAGVVTFPGGTGTYDRATGAGTVSYQGSVTGSFGVFGSTFYRVTVADPVVTVDEDGHGRVTAVVSASNVASGDTPAATSPPRRVLATTFDATGWVAGADGLGTQTATPHWAGVLPPDDERAAALGVPAGQPVDGKAWHPDFLGQLTPGVRPHFYASGSGSDPKKAPAVVVAQGAGVGEGDGGAPALDAPDALRWAVSSAFDQTAAEHTLSGGAEEADDGVVTFPRTGGTYDRDTGAASVTYGGSVTAVARTPVVPGLWDVERYRVTLADPVVTTDPTGAGTVSAVVSSSKPLDLGGPAASTPPTRVEVAAFDAGADPWVDGTARGRLAAQPPVFSAALAAQLVAPARALFGTTTDAAAATRPASFVAGAPAAERLVPALTATTTAATPEGGLVLRVEGTGFRGVTRPGDDGVRVGLAPRGALPDPASPEAFAAAVTVPASTITEHRFTTTLTVPTARLDPAVRYAVHSWQSPDRSNPSQDASVPVEVDFAALGLAEPRVPTFLVRTRGTHPVDGVTWAVGGHGFSAVTKPGDAGIYVGLAESGGLPDVSQLDLSKFVVADWVMPGQMTDGVWSRVLTARPGQLDPAKRYSFYTWQAHRHSTDSQDTETPVRIDWAALRGEARPSMRVPRPRTSVAGRRATLRVVLPRAAAGTVRVAGLAATRTVPVREGVARVAVPARLRAGAYRVRLRYSGDELYAARSLTVRWRVTRPGR